MKSNYKKLGEFIRMVDRRNSNGTLGEQSLYGISVTKEFIETHANLIGVTFNNYKIVAPKQFAYIPDTSRRGDKIAISLNALDEEIIVSSICTVFEVTNESQLLPEYLMLWFIRSEFDRYARFMSNGSAREVFDWDCMCGVELPIPSISEQQRIVSNYQLITKRVGLLRRISDNLISQCQTLYNKMILGHLPNGKLGDIAVINSGKRPDSLSPGDIPLLGAGGIMSYIANYNYNKPSLIIGRVGTHGVVQRYTKFWASDNTLVIDPEYYEFVFHVLRSIDYEVLNRGSTQPLITQGDIKAIDVYIPDVDKIKDFESKASTIMRCFSFYQKEINLLIQIKGLIISNIG